MPKRIAAYQLAAPSFSERTTTRPIMPPDLIDRIYECAFLPDLWPGVLEQLAAIAEAKSGILAAITDTLDWTAPEPAHHVLEKIVSRNIMARSRRHVRAHRERHAGFQGELDIFTEDELAKDPFYTEILWPIGLGWAAFTTVDLPTGGMLALSIERDRARGPVEPELIKKLDALRPHLARSALLSARFHLQRAKVLSETLALIGLPALVFDQVGKTLAANHLIEALQEHLVWRARDAISLRDRAADAQLRKAILTLDLPGIEAVKSFVVRDAEGAPSLIAHIVPVRGGVRDIFARCAGVLILVPLSHSRLPPLELVQSLFDLTAAEARVARSITAGETIDEIAVGGGTSRNTIRSHVRGVLEKTGCRRQAEVVALLSGISIAT